MSSCSIKWCGKNSKNSNYKTDGITFHRFPRDPVIKDAWITATKKENWFPTAYSVICSRHFTPDCFEQLKGNRRRLYACAVPSHLLPHLFVFRFEVRTCSKKIFENLGKNAGLLGRNVQKEFNDIWLHKGWYFISQNPKIKEKWIEATQKKNWYPQKHDVICSRHFTPDCFDSTKKKRCLFSSAVPTLSLPMLVNLVSINYIPDLNVYNRNTWSLHQNVLPVNKVETSNQEEPPSLSTNRKALDSDHTNVSTENDVKDELPQNSTVSTAERTLSRKVENLTIRLRKSQLKVKRLQNMKRHLNIKLNTLTEMLENLKNRGLITQENIDVERLQTSNKQLRKKVVMLRRLLNEQKKTNLYAKRNVVWCPPAEGMLDAESGAETII